MITITTLAEIAVLVIVGTIAFEYIVRWMKKHIFGNGGTSTSRKIVNLFRLVFYIFLIIVSLGILGVNLIAILAGAGFIGIILGLALQAPLSNAFAGVYITLTKLVKEGDHIKVNAIGSNIFTDGIIHHIGFSHVELEVNEGIVKYIPNNLMITSIIEKVKI